MARREHKNDIIAHEWASLKTLAATIDNQQAKADLQKLLGDEPEAWEKLYSAEQIIGMHLDAIRLRFEYDCLLGLATSRALPSLATFQEYKKAYFDDPQPVGATDEEKRRAAYQELLYALQSGFVEARFERQLRAHTAEKLLICGLLIVLLVVGLLVLREVDGTSRRTAAMAIGSVIALGVLGAFFSRVTTFQEKYSSLKFADITNSYRDVIFFVRLLCGGIGAIILYYLMRSGLLGGSLFPEWLVLDGGVDQTDHGKIKTATEWSKLVVWSFIAGFSERLVPDTLEQIGKKASDSNQ